MSKIKEIIIFLLMFYDLKIADFLLMMIFFFWSKFVFVYQRGMTPSGNIALDDITVLPGHCYSTGPIEPHDKNGTLCQSSVTRL